VNTHSSQSLALKIGCIHEPILIKYLGETFSRRRAAGQAGLCKAPQFASRKAHGAAKPNIPHLSQSDPPPHAALAHPELLRRLCNRDQTAVLRPFRNRFVSAPSNRGRLAVMAARNSAVSIEIGLERGR
jgi:hypothetical protein